MIIGITGSFGSGKTTVAKMFKQFDFEVINVDKLYRDIYKKNKSLKNKIKNEFGTLNREKIKKIVFDNSDKLKKLNNITHPIILKALKQEINKINKNKSFKKLKNNKIIVDIPLLFESKSEKLFDKIIVVKYNKKAQIKRILKKKKHSKKEIEQIIKSQMPLNTKLKKADFVIDNNKSLKNIDSQIKKIIKNLKN